MHSWRCNHARLPLGAWELRLGPSLPAMTQPHHPWNHRPHPHKGLPLDTLGTQVLCGSGVLWSTGSPTAPSPDLRRCWGVGALGLPATLSPACVSATRRSSLMGGQLCGEAAVVGLPSLDVHLLRRGAILHLTLGGGACGAEKHRAERSVEEERPVRLCSVSAAPSWAAGRVPGCWSS